MPAGRDGEVHHRKRLRHARLAVDRDAGVRVEHEMNQHWSRGRLVEGPRGQVNLAGQGRNRSGWQARRGAEKPRSRRSNRSRGGGGRGAHLRLGWRGLGRRWLARGRKHRKLRRRWGGPVGLDHAQACHCSSGHRGARAGIQSPDEQLSPALLGRDRSDQPVGLGVGRFQGQDPISELESRHLAALAQRAIGLAPEPGEELSPETVPKALRIRQKGPQAGLGVGDAVFGQGSRQGHAHRLGRFGSRRRVASQQRPHDRRERVRDGAVEQARVVVLHVDDLAQQGRGVGRVEGQLAGEKPVEERPEREEVRLGAGVLALDDLGRHVGRRAHHGAGHGHLLALLEKAGDPEIHELEHPVGPQHDVLGLEIAMHHPRAVSVLQRQTE